MFGAPAPQFTINGKRGVTTPFGGLMTLLVMFLSLFYILLKVEHLFSRKNPSISKFTDATNTDGVYNLNQDDFQLAVGIEHWFEGVKNDGKYLKWMVTHYS